MRLPLRKDVLIYFLTLGHIFIPTSSTSVIWRAEGTTKSADGKAICTEGKASVSIHATVSKFDIAPPSNQFEVTNIIQRVFEVNSTYVKSVTASTATVTGPFQISARLCFPSHLQDHNNVKAVQILSHGLGLDKSYWDIAPGYSYIDAAAKAGYATFAFDRLGVGSSDHPDPINVVQSTTHVEVLHALIQGLKNGDLENKNFHDVVGVGHSYGSVIQVGHDVKYPNDCSAVVLTGLGANFDYLPSALLSNNPTIAKTVRAEDSNLSDGYLLTPTAVAFQQPFFRYPFFDSSVFDQQVANAGTYTLGDEMTSAAVFAPATKYSGPVDIVLGQYDYVFCMGECTTEDASGFVQAFYPSAASASTYYVVPDSGHCINDHRTSSKAYAQMLKFLDANGTRQGG